MRNLLSSIMLAKSPASTSPNATTKASILPERRYVKHPVVSSTGRGPLIGEEPDHQNLNPLVFSMLFFWNVIQPLKCLLMEQNFNLITKNTHLHCPRPRRPQTALGSHAMPSLQRATGAVVSIHNTPHNKPTRQTHLNEIFLLP